MKMLTTALSAVVALALLSGCTTGSYDRYGYAYGPGRFVSYYDRYCTWDRDLGVFRDCRAG